MSGYKKMIESNSHQWQWEANPSSCKFWLDSFHHHRFIYLCAVHLDIASLKPLETCCKKQLKMITRKCGLVQRIISRVQAKTMTCVILFSLFLPAPPALHLLLVYVAVAMVGRILKVCFIHTKTKTTSPSSSYRCLGTHGLSMQRKALRGDVEGKS